MKIKLTDFAKRHFNKDFHGTKISDFTPKEFENKINYLNSKFINPDFLVKTHDTSSVYVNEMVRCEKPFWKEMEGYAPFCKLVAIKNFTDAKVGSLPITLENYIYLRSEYSARTESELPVLCRWFELPFGVPTAEYLILVLYDYDQLEKEYLITYLNDRFRDDEIKMFTEDDIKYIKESYDYDFELNIDDDYGIVAILGQTHDGEEPMKPETMLRNCLGIEYGGSGVVLDKEQYLKSVNFWNNNATIKV